MVARRNRELVLRVQSVTPEDLISRHPRKLSVNQVCVHFGLDVENDTKNRFFWNSTIQDKIKITGDLLKWLGYSGDYRAQKYNISRLLKKNDYIQYDEVSDEENPSKKYYVVNGIDFASLMMQMRTTKAIELRELYAIMKEIVMKYRIYEKMYEERLNDLIRRQNDMLTAQMGNLQTMMASIKESTEEERRRAEEERQRAEERERRAEEERRRAEEERCRAEEERQLAEERERRAEERNLVLQSKLKYGVDTLRNVIAKKMSPNPINKNKVRCLALYKIEENVWYIMRRQFESFKEGERKIYRTWPLATKLRTWVDVAHAVDIGNLVKRRYRNHLRWDARGNVIKPLHASGANDNAAIVVSDAEMVDTFEWAINEENDAHVLANNIAL